MNKVRGARSLPSFQYDGGAAKPRGGALQSSRFVNHEDVFVLKKNVHSPTLQSLLSESLPTSRRGIIT